jgi:tetratricopeptide (TPR) repeat protein
MARLPRFLLLCLLIPGPLAAQTSSSPDSERLFIRGMELQKGGDVIGAIDAYKTALAIDPTRVDALSNLGAAYVHLGQFDEAIARYNAALQIDPSNATVRLNLALAYYKSGRPNEAIQPLKMVVATNPEAKNAYVILADCYLQTGQYPDAVSLLQPREAMFQDDLAFAYVLGTALVRTGDERQGQQYIDRIFKTGDSAEGHLLMGIAHLNRFDYPEAKSELERALQLNSSLPTANSAYARALLGLGDQAGAERAFRRELSINVNDFESNLMLGSMRKSARDFDAALTYLNRAAAIHPGDLTARKLLASLKLQTGAVEEAVEILQQVIAEAPDSVDAHVQLATAYNRLKRKDDADRERAIVDRLNREIQEKQSAVNGNGAGNTTPAPTSTPSPPEGPPQ